MAAMGASETAPETCSDPPARAWVETSDPLIKRNFDVEFLLREETLLRGNPKRPEAEGFSNHARAELDGLL